jgi:DNA-binding SARP family transcriptional activator/ATP/maltotriose-dependent transcriptional regulator MalT
MRQLPAYHVPRPRLTAQCVDQRVVVVEAAGGYGKSVLGAELLSGWWSVGIDIQFDHHGTSANLLAARLRAAVLHAGFSDAAWAASTEGDATGTADAIVNALAHERCTFVFDDVHNAAPDAGALIERIAARLEGDQHLVALARELPTGAERLRRAEYFRLGARDLAFHPDEILALCRSGFGLPTTQEGANALAKLTGGWTAATVLAVARAARTGETAEVVAAAVLTSHPGDAVAVMLEEPIATLGPGCRPLLAQVARLPLLDREVVDITTGQDGFFEHALAAGLPFASSRGQWWELPGPVRDHLATFAPLDREAVRKAAGEYRRRGELGPALELLLASGDPQEAAMVLAATTPEDAENLDPLELQAVFEKLPSEAVDAYPNALVIAARSHGVAYQYARRSELFKRAGDIAERTGNAVLGRIVAAEAVNDFFLDRSHLECIRAARQVLAATGPEERLTRARCYYALARALWMGAYAGERDDAGLGESEESFRRGAELYRALGMRSSLSALLVEKANLIDFAGGRATAALAQLDDILSLVADRPRRWAYVLCFRAKVAAELGLAEECRANAKEIFRVADQYGDEIFRAYGHWRLATLASYNGEAEATLDHVRQAQLHGTESFWSQISADFLAGAADWLDRVGHTALAWEYLGRAKVDPKDAFCYVALSEAMLEARHGDPALAEPKLLALTAEQHVDLRERWRVTLMRAFSAFRRGDHATAGAWAAGAFEEAARMGQPQLPMICERAITEQLLGLAVETGQPAALALEARSLPLSLAVLGRFELREAGRVVALGASQEAKLLKFMAVSGGRVHAEQAIEALWPEVGREAGRNRLRTVTSRLRSMAGEAVIREAEVLRLHDSVVVDLRDFLADARRAQTLAKTDIRLASAVARGAMARYRGEVLPDDPYEDWAERPRQHARQVMLDLLDLCATEAARRGDLDALRRVVEQTIAFDPYDDSRYLQAASALVQQGRRGEALTVVERARSALAELGLEPPRPLLDLERSIVA